MFKFGKDVLTTQRKSCLCLITVKKAASEKISVSYCFQKQVVNLKMRIMMIPISHFMLKSIYIKNNNEK